MKGKIKSIHGIYKKHGRDEFLEAAAYYSDHVNPNSIEHLKRSGKEYVWRDGSDKVTVRGNLWFHQYERIGGDAVDFVRRFYNMDFPQAVNYLLGNNGGTIQRAEPVKRE